MLVLDHEMSLASNWLFGVGVRPGAAKVGAIGVAAMLSVGVGAVAVKQSLSPFFLFSLVLCGPSIIGFKAVGLSVLEHWALWVIRLCLCPECCSVGAIR